MDSTHVSTAQAIGRTVTEGFRAGNSQMLLQEAAERVEISLFGARTFYSRGQAFYVIQNFFRDHPPRRFEVRDTVHAEGSYFLTGRYWEVRTDPPLTVFVRIQAADSQWRVHEIRVETTRR